MRVLRTLILCAVVVALPHELRAQVGFLEGLFRNLDNAGGFWVYAGFLPHSSTLTAGSPGGKPKQAGMQGPGFAFTFHMGSAGVDTIVTAVTPANCQGVSAPADPTCRNPRADTIPTWLFHLALAYSQITGFQSQNPRLDFKGSIRELPRIAWFAQFHPRWLVSPYAGLHMGLLQMQSGAVYDSTGAYYPFAGTTYEVGAVLGFAVNFRAGDESFVMFVEPGYTLRKFASLDWGGGQKTIPAFLPRSLQFTGWEVAVGLEIGVPHPSPGDKGGGRGP